MSENINDAVDGLQTADQVLALIAASSSSLPVGTAGYVLQATATSSQWVATSTLGFAIPTTASTTEWTNKVSSQWVTNGSNISYMAGNVGIGTTTPISKLHVVGTSGAITPFTVASSSLSSMFSVDYDGSIQFNDLAGSTGSLLQSFGASAPPQWVSTSTIVGMFDHGGLAGLADDDHTQYALLAGRSGGQTLIGGTGTTDDLVLRTTSGAGTTGADMIFQGVNNGATEFARFLNNGNFGIATPTPGSQITLGVGQISVPVGSVSAPSYSFTNDLNTGLWTPAVGSFAISTIGIERLRINSSGDVGLGTGSAISARLHVISTSSQMRVGYDTSNYFTAAVSITGGVTFDAVGSGAAFVFRDVIRTTGGSVSAPSLSFSSDTNTGLYSSGTGILSVAAGGVDVMNLNAAGNVGIGTTASARLHVVSTTEQLRVGYDISNYFSTGVSATGVVSFDAVGSGSAFIFSDRVTATGFVPSASTVLTNGMYLPAANTLGFSSASTERMRIDSSGNVGIGTTTPARKLHVITSVDEPPVRFQDSNGYCEINPTSTTWTCTSDERLKDNITDLASGDLLERMSQLRPVNFTWKNDSSDTERTGLIAQEVERIFPDLVNTDEETGMKSVSYGGFTVYLISVVQELSGKLAGLFDGVAEIFVKKVQTDEICVGDICVTEAEFAEVFSGQIENAAPTNTNDDSDTEPVEEPEETSPDPTPGSVDEDNPEEVSEDPTGTPDTEEVEVEVADEQSEAEIETEPETSAPEPSEPEESEQSSEESSSTDTESSSADTGSSESGGGEGAI